MNGALSVNQDGNFHYLSLLALFGQRHIIFEEVGPWNIVHIRQLDCKQLGEGCPRRGGTCPEPIPIVYMIAGSAPSEEFAKFRQVTPTPQNRRLAPSLALVGLICPVVDCWQKPIQSWAVTVTRNHDSHVVRILLAVAQYHKLVLGHHRGIS